MNIISLQRKNIKASGNYDKMRHTDIIRLLRHVNNLDINTDYCVLWKGECKRKIGIVSFRGKKVSLLRLLYHNFMDRVEAGDIIRLKCNRQKCCCLKHIYKVG